MANTQFFRLGFKVKPCSIILILSFLILSCTETEEDNNKDMTNSEIFLSSVKNSVVVSNISKEKMAHCSLVYSDTYTNDGTMWLAYICDETKNDENSSNLNTHPVLCKFNAFNPQEVQRWPIIRPNSEVNGITLGARALYDPNILINKNKIQIFFQALVNKQTALVCQTFNKRTQSLVNDFQVLTIRYKVDGRDAEVPFNDSGITKCAYDLGYKNTKQVNHLMFTSRFVEYKGYIYGALGTLGTFNGAILRTIDGIHWELVSIQPNDLGIMEAQIEINNNIVYFIARSQKSKGCYLGKYDLLKEEWSDLALIDKSIGSRPAIIMYKNKLYIMHNSSRASKDVWGLPLRNWMTVEKVDLQSLNLTEWFTIQYEFGIHYPSITEYNGDIYMSFTEDRRLMSQTYIGDIAFCKVAF